MVSVFGWPELGMLLELRKARKITRLRLVFARFS
jgi:hypothetical protein